MLTKRERFEKIARRLTLWWQGGKRGKGIPLFVFGDMRSGTNMLQDALREHPAVECYRETDDEAFDRVVLRDKDTILALIMRSRARCVLFKCIADSQRAGELLRWFPAARAIWIYRWYEDVVNSALRNFSEHRRYLEHMLYRPQLARWRLVNISKQKLELVRKHYDAGVDDPSARALIWHLRNELFFEQNFDPSRVLLVRYEDLVASPAEELTRILDFVGLPPVARIGKHIHSRSVRRHAAPPIDAEIRELCQATYDRLEAAYVERRRSES